MPRLFRREPVPRAPRRRGVRHFLATWTVPIVGGVTPLLLIAINLAAFIVNHLDAFRWTVAVMAFVSGMMLNTYLGLNIYRVIQRRRPSFPLVNPRNEEIAVVVGMGVITVITFVVSWFCYRGLEDPKNLPDKFTFIYGAVGMGLLVVTKGFFDRDRDRHAAPPGPGPGGRQTVDTSSESRTPPSPPGRATSGYTPPRYLPPS